MNPPRVFISYSHDSAEHKKWVLDFATILRNRGIDAVIDQWDLKPGDDLPHFMETQLEAADYILMICTEKYVQKANAGTGGVGYEKMIITSTLLSKIDNNKIIPIIRQKESDERPTFLKSKLYMNFSNDADTEFNLDELLRTLLNAPLYEKPKIGDNPFAPMGNTPPDRTSDGIKEVMKIISACFENSKNNYITYSHLIPFISMKRISFEKYMSEVFNNGFLAWRITDHDFHITTKGFQYMENHGLLDI